MKPYTVRVWAGSARPGRCRFCRRAIVWVLTEAGRSMPFDLGFVVREVVTHPKTGASFVILLREDRHDCPALALERTGARRRRKAKC